MRAAVAYDAGKPLVVEELEPPSVGPRDVMVRIAACGACWWCLNGMSNHCELGPTVRTTPRFRLPDGRQAPAVCGCGTFAEAMVVHEASLVAVETDLPDEQLALLGCGVT